MPKMFNRESILMKTLRVIQLKPNPIGKDRAQFGTPPPAQLGAEWVDFKNTGTVAVDLQTVRLYHVAYAPGEPNGHWEEIMGFQGSLPSGKVIRVHSGQKRDISVLRQEDLVGADYHLFTGKDSYVWNNGRGDIAALGDGSVSNLIDRASYDANPPEGVVLVRVGEKLVPAVAPARAFNFR
jgi:hypothetical protein